MTREIEINGRKIGPDHPPYVIAEISGNHRQEFDRLIRLIDEAKMAGADAVKLQTYTADSLTIDSPDPAFTLSGGTWDGWNLYALYQAASTPWEWHSKAFEHAHGIGLTIFSSPFDKQSVDLLEHLNVPAYKIASNELTDWPLVEYVAQKGKPMIMSTGTSTKQDISDTLDFLSQQGMTEVCILHCVSAYPALASDAHLETIRDIAESFDVIVGFSDHTLGVETSTAAAAIGARVFEKHLTLDRSDGAPDSSFSAEPAELKQLCQSVRNAFLASRGIMYGGNTDLQRKNVFPRTFWTTSSINAGDIINWDNIKSIRSPNGLGIRTREYQNVIGKVAVMAVPKHQPLEWCHLSSANNGEQHDS